MPTFDQDAFRARNDDGSETAATWLAALNTAVSFVPDTPFRMRFVVQETTTGATNQDFKLQYRLNAGAWTDVTASSAVCQAVNSTHLTDQDDTTQQIGSGTFVADNDGVEDSNGAVPAVADFAGLDETELEFCVRLVAADLSEADVVDLRVVEGDGTAFGTYTNTPAITVDGRYNQVGRTNDQIMGLQTFNRTGIYAANLGRAFGVWHLRDGTHRDLAGTHIDPMIPVAGGYVKVDAVTGICTLGQAFALRGVSRFGRGEYGLLFDSQQLDQRAGRNNLQVKVTPVGGAAWPYIAFTERGSVHVVLYAHKPRFETYNSVTQTTVTEGADVKCDIDTEDVDKGGYFDSTTNDRFDVPVSGTYKFDVSVFASDDGISGPDVSGTSKLKRNGTTVWTGSLPSGGANGTVSFDNVIIDAEEGDYFEVFFNGTATSGNLDIRCTQFDGLLVGADGRGDRVDLDFSVIVRAIGD